MRSQQETFDQLCHYTRETALLASVEALLGWDERTYMPPDAGPYRAEQMTLLSGILHKRNTAPQLGDWLAELADGPLAKDPHSDAGATIRQLKRRYDKQVKLPQKLVEELTRTSVLAQQCWVQARKNNDYDSLRPWLEKTFDLKRQQAEALGYKEHPYDALLDDYEPLATTREVTAVLSGLRDDLVPLVRQIMDSPKKAPVEILHRRYPVPAQERFGEAAASAIGFEFSRGRLDVTAHPFCSGMGPNDCRLTTRYLEDYFNCALFGTLHEAGHGLYEQGLRTEQYGLPPGEFVSLGIHESQSRMWENFVGRSRPFWEHFFPRAQQAFPESLAAVKLDDFYFAINHVEPSLIRVEADEATYNLHILARFELEQALLKDDLQAGDLPGAWNEKYRQFLGIEVHNDADGVLQDIHWSAGLVGYFPTYSLGNLYAAQFFATADADLGGLSAMFRHGQFVPLRDWLREKVHRPGQCYPAAELARRVTGKPLSHKFLIEHLRSKLGPLYGLK
jgi:carboxypeptidase Taq